MFSLQKINDKFQALEFYEYQVPNYENTESLEIKFHRLSNFLRPKNKFNHTLTFDGKSFIISNKEIFVEHLLNLLDISEKQLLYQTFLNNSNHFITSRPKLLSIYLNNTEFTEYVIYNSLQSYISIKSLLSKFNSIEPNWANYIIERLKEDSEYNQYAFTSCLMSLNNCFADYKAVINFKYIFETTDFSRNFWKLYQNLIFHPHIIQDKTKNISRLLTLTSDYYYYNSNTNNYSKHNDCIFKYLNEYLNELNINNIYELFDSKFISFILNNTIDGKIIPYSDATYDMNFNQFVKYCRKNLNK